MREAGLRSRVRRKYVVTTDSRHRLPVAENRLGRDFVANRPNRKWAADITYVRTAKGWLYLAVVMDLYSRRIVGWAMSRFIDARLARDALSMALQTRRPGPGLLHHSDRGAQYAAEAFQRQLERRGIVCSMSRKGDCWDNAPIESFFGKLKSEWIRRRVYRNRNEAKQAIFWYVEVFHNRSRRHAALGYRTPVEFEAQADKGNVA
jgi:transposase InsO family protein